MKAIISIFGIAILLLSQQVSAHHSLNIHYQIKEDALIKGEGVIKKISPRNPHSFMVVSGVTEQGDAIDWVLQLPSKNTLIRMGWHFEDIQPGVKVRFTGFPALKDSPSPAAILQYLYLPKETLCSAFCPGDELSLTNLP